MSINKNFKFCQKKTDLKKLTKFPIAVTKCCCEHKTSSTQSEQTNNDNPFKKYKKTLTAIRKDDLL